MEYSNSEILAAVVNRFVQPIVIQFTQAKASTLPFVQMIENKVKSWGIVSPNWNLTSELSPIIESTTGELVKPLLKQYLSNIPDDAIPQMAHSIVDNALKNGSLNFMEGKIQIEKSDLEELKKLLDWNLPIKGKNEYQVITSEPDKEMEADDGTDATEDKQPLK